MYIKEKPNDFMISDILCVSQEFMLAVTGEHSHNFMCLTQCE